MNKFVRYGLVFLIILLIGALPVLFTVVAFKSHTIPQAALTGVVAGIFWTRAFFEYRDFFRKQMVRTGTAEAS